MMMVTATFLKLYLVMEFAYQSKLWVFEDDRTPTKVESQRAMKKVTYAVFFRSTGLVKAIKLEGQTIAITNWYATICLPETPKNIMNLIIKDVCEGPHFENENKLERYRRLAENRKEFSSSVPYKNEGNSVKCTT
ncbi:UNVERIFIED_CONTAM: hypothetical protein NCL1_25871 [Trichonephila clavipes]